MDRLGVTQVTMVCARCGADWQRLNTKVHNATRTMRWGYGSAITHINDVDQYGRLRR